MIRIILFLDFEQARIVVSKEDLLLLRLFVRCFVYVRAAAWSQRLCRFQEVKKANRDFL
jgi:hypothetical protein